MYFRTYQGLRDYDIILHNYIIDEIKHFIDIFLFFLFEQAPDSRSLADNIYFFPNIIVFP